MANWDDVRKIALALPQTTEGTSWGSAAWKVHKKLFVWERPLRSSDVRDLTQLGQEVPEGPILGARVENELAKQVLIADDPSVFFTTPHFDGYAAILVKLDAIAAGELEEVIVEAWLEQAPARLRKEFLEQRDEG